MDSNDLKILEKLSQALPGAPSSPELSRSQPTSIASQLHLKIHRMPHRNLHL